MKMRRHPEGSCTVSILTLWQQVNGHNWHQSRDKHLFYLRDLKYKGFMLLAEEYKLGQCLSRVHRIHSDSVLLVDTDRILMHTWK